MNIYDQLDLIKQKEEFGTVEEVCTLYNEIIRQLKRENIDNLLGEVYACFAEFLFSHKAYEQSIAMFINAYNKDFMPDAIKQTLYAAFIDGNQEFLQSCYEKNIKALANANELLKKYKYEDLPLDFFGTDGVYQIFCKDTNKFTEKIKIDLIDKNKTFKLKDDFSDFVVYINYKFFSIHSLLHFAKEKNRCVYIIVENIECFLACLKLDDFSTELENVHVFSSVEQFKGFFIDNTDVYLPRNIFSTGDDSIEKINHCLTDIHNTRISMPKDRQNILLTIGIPSYNRGHRALQAIQHLLSCAYDSEVEFLVSNNDSSKNIEGYSQIKDIAKDDCRVSYYDVDPSSGKPGFFRNFSNVLDKAKGKYCLFVSDEDFVILENLHVYLSLMRDNLDVAIICASGTGALDCRKRGGRFTKGAQAQDNFFLANNYISGAIYNKSLFTNIEAQKWLNAKNTGDNLAFNLYPHMFLDTFMLKHGDLIRHKLHLIEVDETINEQTSLSYSDKVQGLTEYSVYDSRLLQHRYWCEFAKEMADGDDDLFIELNQRLIGKTVALINIVKPHQIDAGIDWQLVTQQTVDTILQNFDLYVKYVFLDKKKCGLDKFEKIKKNLKDTVIDLLKTGKYSN